MQIDTIVSTEYSDLEASTTVSKLIGVFDDPDVDGVVVTDDGDYEGVVTRRQLTASQYQPDQTIETLVWDVPTVSRRADVREVARLMLESDVRLLPVFEGKTLEGVVTATDLLDAVLPFLDAATVSDVITTDLVTVAPDDTFGKTINLLREHRITHLPVVEDSETVGILSLYDLTDFTARSQTRSQGGNASAGGGGAASGGQAQGGYGAREGERDHLLDLPVQDVMVTPVETIDVERTLQTAVEQMFEAGCSSLVVTGADGPAGIVTKTDVLEALTWQDDGSRAVQVTGMDLLNDMNYYDVVDMVEGLARKSGDGSLVDAKLHLQKHQETHRGTPLLRASLRVQTDDGLLTASGEGYGASNAVNEVQDVMERRIRDRRTRGKSKKHPDEAFWDRRFGWLLEE